jgi:gamma-glutamyltranspeptidase/glutathione hydrolase
MSARGAVAAGHPLTAEAGARVLREGGNAIDAAVAAVLTSFVAESPLTGLGAGGFMLVHTADTDVLIDFFVGVPGAGKVERSSELVPVEILFDGNPQIFNIGAASCGVPGTGVGLWSALERFGTAAMDDLAGPAAALAREGVEVNAQQSYLHELLRPVLTTYPECAELYAPGGDLVTEGRTFRFPDLGDALERFAVGGPDAIYRGESGAAVCSWVLDRGGILTERTWRPTARSTANPYAPRSVAATSSPTRRPRRAAC